MKKSLALALALAATMLPSLAACGGGPAESSSAPNTVTVSEPTPEPIPEYVPTAEPTPEPEESKEPSGSFEVPAFDDAADWKSKQLQGLNVKYPGNIEEYLYEGEGGHYYSFELTIIEGAARISVDSMTAFYETFSEELESVDLNEYKEAMENEFNEIEGFFMEQTSFLDRSGLYMSFTFKHEGVRYSIERILFSDDETDYDIMFFCPTEVFDDCAALYYQMLDELTLSA